MENYKQTVIRFANTSDIAQIQKVATLSWHDTYDNMIPRDVQDRFLVLAYSEERLQSRIENSLFLVAEVKGEIIGFANFTPNNNLEKVHLSAIYLLPKAQGAKIGTRLLAEGCKYFGDAKSIFVEVEADNEKAKQFYYAYGFTFVEEYKEELFQHELHTIRLVYHP